MIASVRTLELEGDYLRCEMEMQTTAVEQLEKHLEITLQRVKQYSFDDGNALRHPPISVMVAVARKSIK